MSTKTTNTQQAAFDPQSMSFYQGLLPQIQQGLSYFMNTNPMQNPLFQAAYGQNMRGALGQGLSMLPHIASSGWGGQLQPFQMGNLQNAAKGGLMGRQGAFTGAMGSAIAPQMQATGTAAGFNPLQIGGTTTGSQTGLGSWLPSLLSAGVGAGMQFL